MGNSKIWFLHIDGIHLDLYRDLEKCISVALSLVRDGHEIHIQTHDQWLFAAESHEAEVENAFLSGVQKGKRGD